MKELIRYGLVLGIICLCAAGLLASVNSATKAKIQAQIQIEIDQSLREVLPEAVEFAPVTSGQDILYYKAYNDTKTFVGVAFIAKAKGYSSVIETMVGMRPEGRITAIKILSQNETPGLGSRITEVQDNTTIFDCIKGKKIASDKKAWFQLQFYCKAVSELDSVEAITGATISSKAVIDSVKTRSREILQILQNEK